MTVSTSWNVRPLGLFTSGEHAASRGAQSFEVINPSSGRPLYALPEGSGDDVDRVVADARAVFEAGAWSAAPPSFRKRVLHRLADLIGDAADELDLLDAEEMGKPVSEAFCSARSAANLFRYCAEALDKASGEVALTDSNSLVLYRLAARGVVAAITPWNFPTYVAALKVAPALAAGNSVVLKPSELSNRSTLRLAELAMEAGLPAGVLNVVCGRGDIVGRALALHMDVDMLTFTGSTAVGKLLMEYAGQSNLKVVKAECGGKSPQIIFGDGVDLAAASRAVAAGLLINQGQVCSVGSRLLVERSLEAEVIELIAERLTQIRVGDATDPQTTYGPIVSTRQCERIMSYVEGAAGDGAELVRGGRRLKPTSRGNFIEPTIFRNVPPGSRLAQEEVFGPVLSVITFEDEAEAVRIANGTNYGLAANVWTADLSRGLRVSRTIRSGVNVNAAPPVGEGAGFGFSFEPARQSGVGVEGGLPGLKSYFRRQTVRFNHA